MKPLWWIDRVMSDSRLSIEARGLLVWLGGRPSGWRYSVPEAQTAMGVGRQKYQGMVSEAKASGYLDTEPKRDRLGRIKYVKVVLRDASPEVGKSCFRKKAVQKSGYKAAGPEVGKSCQTSLTEREPPGQAVSSPRIRLIVGGRDA